MKAVALFCDFHPPGALFVAVDHLVQADRDICQACLDRLDTGRTRRGATPTPAPKKTPAAPKTTPHRAPPVAITPGLLRRVLQPIDGRTMSCATWMEHTGLRPSVFYRVLAVLKSKGLVIQSAQGTRRDYTTSALGRREREAS